MQVHISIILGLLPTALARITVDPGPKYPPTNGEIWPQPRFQLKQDKYYVLDPSHFKIKITEHSCDIMMAAIDRYDFTMHIYTNLTRRYRRRNLNPEPWSDFKYQGLIRELNIILKNPCEEYPNADMDEAYNLKVGTTSFLKSASIWGIIRGLESFSHLFYLAPDFNQIRINGTEITDYPRYAHRGILLDTSRHYFSMDTILKTLDAMSMNKLNVFHWHIVDDQSFPYESAKLPDLSRRGAFHPSMVYTKRDVDTVITYARDRGIRVVPEFDVPGHTRSWGAAYPNILTECYDNQQNFVGLGPMNPLKNSTYKLLRNLLAEVEERFPERYLHVGGDEVQLSCWQSNPAVRAYMQANNLTPTLLHGMFMEKVLDMLSSKSQAIVWQELFDEGITLSPDTLVQVWKHDWVNKMKMILQSGYKLLFSSEWYLDILDQTFIKMLSVDPRQAVIDDTHDEALAKGIVGGEACMWGEMADDTNVISRMWPRASAVAERLWSPLPATLTGHRKQVPNEALHRIEEHVCRMNRRGIAAEPATGPGFCVT